jgi:hypothetical protein
MFYFFWFRLHAKRNEINVTYTNWKVYRVKICWNPIQSPLYTHIILTSVAIFQLHQRMEFTFHNSYVFLELVPSTEILWTELSCWSKSYSNVITILLTVKKYPMVWCTVWQHTFERWIHLGAFDAFHVILTINNAKSKNLPSTVTKWLPN